MSPWTLGFVLGGVVVVVVAVLLITILSVAKKIERLAGTALEVAGGIESATQPIWAIGTANRVIENIVRAVRSVDSRVEQIASTVEGGGA